MDKYIALAGVKRITPHQFRHTHATIIFSSGASKTEDAYIAAHRLGHSVKYSLDTYGDLYKEREKEVLKKLQILNFVAKMLLKFRLLYLKASKAKP